MIGVSGLSARDDELHLPRPGDFSWAETSWFAAQIPERQLCLWLYPLFRPTMNVMSCAVYVWGPGSGELWRQPYYRQYWHQPIPDGFRLTNFELPIGLAYRVIEPLSEYELRYADGDSISIELNYRSLHPPHELGISGDHGHFDQLGRVTGELVLAGEKISIDCIEMRDRTWSPRRERRDGTWLSYSYGAVDDRTAFHCATRIRSDFQVELLGGFSLSEGVVRPLVQGRRRVERDSDGRPNRIFVSGVDDAGVAVEARGEVISLLAMNTSPYFVFVSQVHWRMADGTEAWGEDQDTWSPGLLRALMPDLLAGRR